MTRPKDYERYLKLASFVLEKWNTEQKFDAASAAGACGFDADYVRKMLGSYPGLIGNTGSRDAAGYNFSPDFDPLSFATLLEIKNSDLDEIMKEIGIKADSNKTLSLR